MSGDRLGVARGGRWGRAGWWPERLASQSARSGTEVGMHTVGAAPDSLGAPLFALVAHGVAQHLHGTRRQDREAVPVKEGVQLSQRQCAVTGQECEADRPQPPTPEPIRILDHRWEDPTAEHRWSPAALPRHARIELLAQVGELVGDPTAGGAELVEVVVDRSDLVEEIVAPGLDAQAGPAIESGLHAGHEQAVAEQAIEAMGSDVVHCGPRWWKVCCEDAREPGPSMPSHLPHPH
jgi:hypothetical protein